MSVVIETTLGAVTVDLYVKARPKACKNFLKLCKIKFYNLCLFHNVQSGFLAQTGDPSGTGRGGESVFKKLYGDQATYFEGDSVPKIKHTKKGLVSMAGAGDNLFGSQFFFTLDDGLSYLDSDHLVFGEVVEGMEIVDKMNEVISDDDHRPYQDVRITHTVVLDDPFEDPKGLSVPERSPSPDPERLRSGRLGADEDLEDEDGLTADEVNERRAAKEAKAQATILEMVGDLPDADCAPPENVLFVCKLNPVTTDDDLQVIFSRFGKVVSCEVIRDFKSGDSLQYAFVEFDNPKSCEDAYFKMDNVLIDDRRIHVDFSQSVSKFRWKGKGRLEVMGDKDQKTAERKPARRSRSRSRDRGGPRRDAGRRPSPSRSPPRRKRSRSPSPARRRRSRSKEQNRRSPASSRRRSRSRDRKDRRRTPERRRSKERRRSRSREDRRKHDRNDRHRR